MPVSLYQSRCFLLLAALLMPSHTTWYTMSSSLQPKLRGPWQKRLNRYSPSMRWEDEALMEWKSRWTNIYLLFLSSVHALAPQQKRLFERAKYWRKLATTSLIPTSCSLIVQGQKGTCLSEESLNPAGSHSALPPMTQLQHWCHNTTAYLCYSLKSSASSTLSSFIFFNSNIYIFFLKGGISPC